MKTESSGSATARPATGRIEMQARFNGEVVVVWLSIRDCEVLEIELRNARWQATPIAAGQTLK